MNKGVKRVQRMISQITPLQVLWLPKIGIPFIVLPPSIGLFKPFKILKVLAKGGEALANNAGMKKYITDSIYR